MNSNSPTVIGGAISRAAISQTSSIPGSGDENSPQPQAIKHTVSLIELLDKHPDLSTNNGDPIFRRSLWGPLFENLHENKVIYRERFICLARIDDLKITERGIIGTVVPLVYLFTYPDLNLPERPWHFGGSWARMRQSKSSLGQPYAGWTIWPEASLIRAVEFLLAKGDTVGALELVQGSEE